MTEPSPPLSNGSGDQPSGSPPPPSSACSSPLSPVPSNLVTPPPSSPEIIQGQSKEIVNPESEDQPEETGSPNSEDQLNETANPDTELQDNGQDALDVKRGRGRPKGVKNKPKLDSEGNPLPLIPKVKNTWKVRNKLDNRKVTPGDHSLEQLEKDRGSKFSVDEMMTLCRQKPNYLDEVNERFPALGSSTRLCLSAHRKKKVHHRHDAAGDRAFRRQLKYYLQSLDPPHLRVPALGGLIFPHKSVLSQAEKRRREEVDQAREKDFERLAKRFRGEKEAEFGTPFIPNPPPGEPQPPQPEAHEPIVNSTPGMTLIEGFGYRPIPEFLSRADPVFEKPIDWGSEDEEYEEGDSDGDEDGDYGGTDDWMDSSLNSAAQDLY